MKKTILTSSIIVIVLIFIGLFYVKQNTYLLDNKSDAIIVYKSDTSNVDFSDKHKLSKASENIFIGEVIEKVGNEAFKGTNSMQFKVRVTQNIKGGFLDDIIVNQQAGYYKKEGKLYLSQFKGDALLKPGNMYLFSTSPEPGEKWQVIIPVYGNIKIQTEQQKFKLIDEFKNALDTESKSAVK